MKIVNLSEKNAVYTSNVYLITGTWNKMEDVNTLIDVGRDPAVIKKIHNAPTGVGKHKVEQVVLTHNHYDHTSLLPWIRKIFNPVVNAFSSSLEGVDHLLEDGETLKLADRTFEVIHMPGHSSDSICLYCEEDSVLFAGDAPIVIQSASGTYEEDFICALKKLCRRNICSIYFGHGNPILEGCNKIIRASLKNIMKGTIKGTIKTGKNIHP